MQRISVDTIRISSQSDKIASIAKELEKYADQVNQISDRLGSSSSSRAISMFQSTLKTYSQNLMMQEQSARTMATLLKQISDTYNETEKQILNGDYNETSNVNQTASDIISELAGLSKSDCIRDYESANPDMARKVDEYLKQMSSVLTEDDIQNIKYLIYSAKEPYRTIFLNNLKNFNVTDLQLPPEEAFYHPWTIIDLFTKNGHTLHYSYPYCFGNDPRGSYTTLFHESGHAIDDLADESKSFGSDTENYKAYSSGMGKEVTVREAILYDVYDNKSNPHSMISIATKLKNSGDVDSSANVTKVINAIRKGVPPKNLSPADRELYNAIINEHRSSLENSGKPSAHYESVSDVYGGVSDNVLRNGYGHDSKYWNDKSKAAKELWAEYFSYNMADDADNLAFLKEYFPEAAQILESYANDLVN